MDDGRHKGGMGMRCKVREFLDEGTRTKKYIETVSVEVETSRDCTALKSVTKNENGQNR